MGSTSEYLDLERRANRRQQHLDEFRQQFSDLLKRRLGDTAVDLTFMGTWVKATFPYPRVVIKVDTYGPARSDAIPTTRAVVRLEETLKGNLGDLRKEIRSACKTEQVSMDRVVDQVFDTYQLVEPLYRYRKNVKDLVWPIFGLDPREVEDYREIKYQGRDLWISIKWDTSYSDGSETCCVGVELREPHRDPYDHSRTLTWLFDEDGPADLEVNIDLFKQKIQAVLQKWDQEDREKLGRSTREQNNKAVVARLREKYIDVDLDCVSMEATPDNFRLTVWFNTEEDVVALLKWIRQHRMEPNGKGDDAT